MTKERLGPIKSNWGLPVKFTSTVPAANYVRIFNALTTGSPKIAADGKDNHVSLTLSPKGGFGSVILTGSGGNVLVTGSGGTNYLSVNGSLTGQATRIFAEGADTNIALLIAGKGYGKVDVNGVRLKAGSVFQRRHVQTSPDPGSTTTTYTTGGAALVVGSPTTPLSINTRTRRYRRNTNNITVGSGILQTGYTSTQRRWDPHLEGLLFTGTDITHVRYWFGLFSASPNNVNDPAALHFAAFRYITSVDGTAFWRTVTSDGATSNIKTSTAAIAASTEYRLRIECELAIPEGRFYVDDVLVGTHTANLPALDTMLGHGLWFQPLATAGGTRFFEWSYVDLSMN